MKRALTALAIIAVPASAQPPRAGSVAPSAMRHVAPALADYTDDVLFGDVWRRPELASRDRSLVTGVVVTDTAFRGTGGSRLGGARVTFQPGAPSNWHSHPLGQVLVVTVGRGLIQDEGGRVHTIRTGDTIWTAPGVRHWHGAAPDSAVTHVAVSESVDGSAVAWREAVSSAQYGAPPVD